MINSFRYSSPIFYQTLSFFLVFWPNEIVLIVLCAIAITAINEFAARLEMRNAISHFLLSLSRFILFPIPIAFLIIIYSAAFRGNMVIPYTSPTVTFTEMLGNLRTRKWSLLTTIGMADEEAEALASATGGVVAETVQSSSLTMERACSSTTTILRMFDIERALEMSMDKSCALSKISPSPNEHDEKLRVLLTQNGDTLPYYLLFSRGKTSRRVVDYVNYALRMFSEDQMNRFWNVRFMRERGNISLAALHRYQKTPPTTQRYDPITLLQISPVFGLCVSGMIFCCLHRRISHAVRRLRKQAGQWVVPHDKMAAVFDS
ncbi:hypothetical protein PMAYCL1PPCAC_04262, partial [Pristionchus mayeri]